MKKIGDYILQLRNKYGSKPDHIIRKTVNYSQANKIGILFNIQADEAHTQLNQFVAKLQKDGKQVTALAFFEREASNPYNFSFDFFRQKDISTTGNIRSETVSHFIETAFDYLYCIQAEPFAPFDYILARSHAKCRISRFFEKQEVISDLSIALPEDANESALIREMQHYTEQITQN